MTSSIWRRPNRKDNPKFPPHLLRISKKFFFACFYSDYSVVQLEFFNREILKLENNLVKITVKLDKFSHPNRKFLVAARLILKGYDIIKYLKSSGSLILKEENAKFFVQGIGKYVVSDNIPYFKVPLQRVLLVRRVDIPLKDMMNKADKALWKIGVIDFDGDYLENE